MRVNVWRSGSMRVNPSRTCPMSLKNDGHLLLLQEPLEAAADHYRILVEKVE